MDWQKNMCLAAAMGVAMANCQTLVFVRWMSRSIGAQ